MTAKIAKKVLSSVATLALVILTSLPLRAQTTDSISPSDQRYLALIDSSFLRGSQGDWAVAETYLRRAMQEKPNHPLNIYLLNNLGGLQQLQGKTEEAILSYSAALERVPDEQTIRFNRARLFFLVGQHQAAITDFSLLVAKSPDNELYRYQRAMAYLMTAQYDLADLDLSAIIQRNGESLKARIGYALLETMRGRYNEAERLYDYLVSKLAKSPEVYEGRARLYLARGMKGYAIRDVQRAFELAGASASATLYRLRAEIARSSGDEASAKRDEDIATKLERQIDPFKPLDKAQ